MNIYRIYNSQVFDNHIRFPEILLNKKNWKVMKCPSIKSPPLSYGNDLFLKKRIIMYLLFKMQKNTYF